MNELIDKAKQWLSGSPFSDCTTFADVDRTDQQLAGTLRKQADADIELLQRKITEYREREAADLARQSTAADERKHAIKVAFVRDARAEILPPLQALDFTKLSTVLQLWVELQTTRLGASTDTPIAAKIVGVAIADATVAAKPCTVSFFADPSDAWLNAVQEIGRCVTHPLALRLSYEAAVLCAHNSTRLLQGEPSKEAAARWQVMRTLDARAVAAHDHALVAARMGTQTATPVLQERPSTLYRETQLTEPSNEVRDFSAYKSDGKGGITRVS